MAEADRFREIRTFLEGLEGRGQGPQSRLVVIKTDSEGKITNAGEIFDRTKLDEVKDKVKRELGQDAVAHVDDFARRLQEEALSIDDVRRITQEELENLKRNDWQPGVKKIEAGVSKVLDPVVAELWRITRKKGEGGVRSRAAAPVPELEVAERAERPLHSMEPVYVPIKSFVHQGTTYTEQQIDAFRTQKQGIERQVDDVVKERQVLEAGHTRAVQELYDRTFSPRTPQPQRLPEDQYHREVGQLQVQLVAERRRLDALRLGLVNQLTPIREVVREYDKSEVANADLEEQIVNRAVADYCFAHIAPAGEPPEVIGDDNMTMEEALVELQRKAEDSAVRDDWWTDLGIRRRYDALLDFLHKKTWGNPDKLARLIADFARRQVATYKAIEGLWYDGWKNKTKGGVGKSFIETILPLGGLITGWHIGRALEDPVIDEAVHTKYGHMDLHAVAEGEADAGKKRIAFIIRRTTGNSIGDDIKEVVLSAESISHEQWQTVLEVPDLPVDYKGMVEDILRKPTIIGELANSADYELFRNVTMFAYLMIYYPEHYKGIRDIFLREFEKPHLLTGNRVVDYENLVDLYYYTAWTHPSMAPYWVKNLETGLKGGGLSPGWKNFIGTKNMIALGWDPELGVDENLARLKRPDERGLEYSLPRRGGKYFDFDALNLPEDAYRVVYVETDDTAYRAVTINQGTDRERRIHLRSVYVQGEVVYDRPNNQGNPKSVAAVELHLTETPEGYVLNTAEYEALRGKSLQDLMKMNSSEIRRLTGMEKKAWMQVEAALSKGQAVWQYNDRRQLEAVTELSISSCSVPKKKVDGREFIDYGISFSERGFNTNMGGIVNAWAQYMGYMMDLRISLMNMVGVESYLEKFKIWKEEIMSYERRKHVRWSELLGETNEKMEAIGERMSDMFLGWIWNNRKEGVQIVQEARELLRMGLKKKFYGMVHFKLLGIEGDWAEAQYMRIGPEQAVRMGLQEMSNKTVMQEGYLEGLIERRLNAEDPGNRNFEYRIYNQEQTVNGVTSRTYIQRVARLREVSGKQVIVYSEAEGREEKVGENWENRTPNLNWRTGEQVKWNVLDDFYDALVAYSRSKITKEIGRNDLARRRDIFDNNACVQLSVLGLNPDGTKETWKDEVLKAEDLHPYIESAGIGSTSVKKSIFLNMFNHAIETYPGEALWTIYELGDLHKIKYKLVDRYVERKWDPLHTDTDPDVLAVPFDAWDRLVHFYTVYRSMKYAYGGDAKVESWRGQTAKVQGSYIVDPLIYDPILRKGNINHLRVGLDILQSELVGTGGTDPGESRSMGPQMLFYDSDMEMYHWLAKHSPGYRIGYCLQKKEPLEQYEVQNIANIVTIHAMINYLVRSTTFDPEDGKNWREKTHATKENVDRFVHLLKERRIHDPKEGKPFQGAEDPAQFFEAARDVMPKELEPVVGLVKGQIGATGTDTVLRLGPPAIVATVSGAAWLLASAASPMGIASGLIFVVPTVVSTIYSMIFNRDYNENTQRVARAINLRLGFGLERLRLSGRSAASLYSRRIIAPENLGMTVRSRGLGTTVLDWLSTRFAGNEVIWGDFIEELPKEAEGITKNKEMKGGHPSYAGPKF